MFPDSPFAHSVGSFQTPVSLPQDSPTADPLVTVCFNQSWLPYVVGCLQQLLLQSTWKDEGPGFIDTAQENAFALISQFTGDKVCCPPAEVINWEMFPQGGQGGPYTTWYGYNPEQGKSAILVMSFFTAMQCNGITVEPPYQSVGGYLFSLDLAVTLGGTYHVTTVDCDGQSHHYTGSGNLSILGNPASTDSYLVTIQIETSELATVSIIVAGDYTCVVGE